MGTNEWPLTVVLSELRGQPRGHYVLSDVAGAANSARAQLVPGSVDPGAITWLVLSGDGLWCRLMDDLTCRWPGRDHDTAAGTGDSALSLSR